MTSFNTTGEFIVSGKPPLLDIITTLPLEPDSKEDSGVLDLTKEEDSQADVIPLEEPKPDSQK